MKKNGYLHATFCALMRLLLYNFIRLKRIALILLLFFSCVNVRAQTTIGTDFWLTSMYNYIGNDSFFIIVSAEKSTNVTIEIPRMGFSQNVSLGFNDLKRVFISSAYKPTGADTSFDCGIHVTSTLPISVYTLSAQSATTDASCIFPTNVHPRGGTYYTSNPRVLGSGYNQGSHCGIVAIDDTVSVEITPSVNTRAGLAWGQKYTKTLLKGQVYIFTGVGSATLEGSLIKAAPGKRVAVFSGDRCVAVRCAACDHVYEQIPPTTTLGRKFIITPFYNQNNGYDYQVIAIENGTNVQENGTTVATLNAGQVFHRQVRGDSSFCIEGNKPILLVQYMTGKNCQAPVGGDPAMLVLNPLEQTISYAMVSTSNTTLVKDHYITIVVPKNALDSVYLDGSLIPRGDFDTAGCGDFFFYRSTVTPGNHRIQCRFGFTCYLYGIGGFESYAYSAGSGMRNLKRYIVAESYPSCDSGFIVKLRSVGDSATQFRWTFDNKQTDTTKTPFFTVAKPGIYKVKLLYKLLNIPTWDSSFDEILVEKPQFSDFITFDKKTICDTAFTLNLPNTKLFDYTWSTGEKTPALRVRNTGKYKVRIQNVNSGCVSYDSCFLTFHKPVKVDFGYYMSSYCPGIPLYLYDSTKVNSDTIRKRSWFADQYLISNSKNDTIKSPRANKYDIKLVVETNKGCVDSTIKSILITDVPIARTGVVKYDTCFASNLFRFNNGSSVNVGRIVRLKWLFGNGDTSSGIQVFKTFKDSGTYSFRLIAFSETGCFDTSDAKFITIHPKPQASMQVVDSSVCFNGNYFDFRNTTLKDGRAQSSTWLWGDGYGTFLTNLGKMSFEDTGISIMKLVSSFTQTGCGDTTIRKVRVFPNPKATMDVDSFNYCLNRNYYQFTNTTVKFPGATESLTWDWGDGTQTLNNSSVKKTFNTTGTFRVRLFYSLGKGCNDTARKNVIVYQSPTAAFSLTDSNICGTNNFFKINNQSTAAGNARWNWTYGDGNSSILRNPPNAAYNSYGNFTITLAVREPLTGCVDTAIRKVKTIKFPALKAFISDSAVCLPSDSFILADSTIYGGMPPSRTWIFNGGSADTSQRVVKYFSTPGVHQIRLIGGKAGVCADTADYQIRVRYANNPFSIAFSQKQLCAPARFDIFANGGNGNWNYNWTDTAGNRKFSGQAVLNVAYTKSGSYPIILKASDDLPCIFEVTDTLTVFTVPTAVATVSGQDKQCLKGNQFDFTGTASNGTAPYSWFWTFGDATSSTFQSPNAKKYLSAGIRQVQLIVTDKNNCADTTVTATTVFDMPETRVHDDSGCTQSAALVTATNTLPAQKIKTVTWQTNNAIVFAGNPYTSMFGNPGIQLVQAITETTDGCKDTSAAARLISYPAPVARFGVTIKTANSLGVPVEFTDSSLGATSLQWIPETGVIGTSAVFNHIYKQLGQVTARLIASNSFGCSDTAARSFVLLSGSDGWVPTAFTPDGNGKNEKFGVGGLSAVNRFQMKIYNRWGQKIYQTDNTDEGWDGTFMGEQAPEGVYAYEIDVVYFNGIRRVFTGMVTLLR